MTFGLVYRGYSLPEGQAGKLNFFAPWKLANFLLVNRTTPQAMTEETLAMVLMGRNIRTRLDVLKPNIRK